VPVTAFGRNEKKTVALIIFRGNINTGGGVTGCGIREEVQSEDRCFLSRDLRR